MVICYYTHWINRQMAVYLPDAGKRRPAYAVMFLLLIYKNSG